MNLCSSQAEILKSFEADGYVVLRQFLDGPLLGEVLTQVERFIRDVVPKLPSEHVFYENKNDPRTLKQIQKMGDHDPWFHEIFAQGCFRSLAESVLRGPVVPKNMQYFNKPAGIGQATPPHQDGYYFMLTPCEAVTMWFALDEVDEENGCVRYVRGSHKNGLRSHARTQTLGFSQGIVDYPNAQDLESEIAISAKPGDLLIHHALTVHRADQNNTTTRSRRALGFIYYSENAREDAASHAAYQRQLSDELKSQGKI